MAITTANVVVEKLIFEINKITKAEEITARVSYDFVDGSEHVASRQKSLVISNAISSELTALKSVINKAAVLAVS